MPVSGTVWGSALSKQGYAKLEERLALLHWLHVQLGYVDTLHLLKNTNECKEEYDSNGRSWISLLLESRSIQMPGLAVADLERYDNNIRCHLAALNARRTEKVTLRYFQYLAALYSEIYLDFYFNRRKNLLYSLNEFVLEHNAGKPSSLHYDEFAETDLDKLAFWMATGSGKTLLMHMHYRQFLHYNCGPPDNILLVTTNYGLSLQHLGELEASNIPGMRFDFEQGGASLGGPETVKVIEITKLVEDKKGRGVSVPIDTFEGENLVFVDEGHKGSGGEAWRKIRGELAKKGFTFEYSATFGQAVAAAAGKRRERLLSEYGKAVAFDYSYRHFYQDGFGKDFNILNLRESEYDEQMNTLLMANLLSFYEQLLVFDQQRDALQPYNLARPLWILVGSKVNAVYRKDGKQRSEILIVARFLHRVLTKRKWAVKIIDRLLNGQSDLRIEKSRQDIFQHRFGALRSQGQDAKAIYEDAMRRVMHTGGGGLQLHELHGCEGEIGMKSAGGDDYFGLIYIGDTGKFKNLVEADRSGIAVGEDQLQGSLFEGINESDSKVEILAGARKFIEGWDSWRVSNMGLLNIGKSEGSLIIQLFGRGVRLKGSEMSLKRSSALGGGHPADIKLLETLNVFALRADYMAQFREYLRGEGILAHETIELPLFIQTNDEFLEKGLLIPRLDEDRDFGREETVVLEKGSLSGPVRVEMSTTVQEVASGQDGMRAMDARSGVEQTIPEESLALVDWNGVYLAMLEYKQERNMSNLVVKAEKLEPILAESKEYRLLAEKAVFKPRNFDDRQRLQSAVTSILRAYTDALYRQRLSQWEGDNLIYRELDRTDDNFRFNVDEEEGKGRYFVRVPKDNMEMIEHLKNMIDECNELYERDQDDLPRIHFDRHLYQPLLIEGDGVTSSPQGLTESERRFVDDLKSYCEKGLAKDLSGAELYLLRNLSRGKGVGFFDNGGVYPDFILWVKTEEAQRIVFVEPHGMLNEKAYMNSGKAKLHERLPELAQKIASRTGNPKVELDSFIVSATEFQVLKKHYGEGCWTEAEFADKHILFPECDNGYSYIEKILRGCNWTDVGS